MDSREKIRVKDLGFSYGEHRVLDGISETFASHSITAIVGPSGQGKSTFLGLFNRMWDGIPGARARGEISLFLSGRWMDPMARGVSLPLLRRKVAMVFQEPNPLPMSIGKNMAFPLKLAGVSSKPLVREKIRNALTQAYLWDEVKDRLDERAADLSGGQKQRLCIARALVLEPEILLCDEPTSSLDPKAAGVIEDLLVRLKERCTLLFVSHSMEQVRRIADRALGLRDGKLAPLPGFINGSSNYLYRIP